MGLKEAIVAASAQTEAMAVAIAATAAAGGGGEQHPTAGDCAVRGPLRWHFPCNPGPSGAELYRICSCSLQNSTTPWETGSYCGPEHLFKLVMGHASDWAAQCH